MGSESQPPTELRPDVDTYAGVSVVEPRGVGAIAILLRSRPSSDLALVGALATNAFIGGKLIEAGDISTSVAALMLPALMWLLTLRNEGRDRGNQQTRAPQPGA